ncbi:GDSL-type esterase/lipase family protein [Sediminibacterium ginsengisoli]|uniref:Lysophospholipase L1 n=1 Tax=Sediminibacterium ginsengisoli TaxID=413434 RepID=A0A1T4PA10_9BACT|nr:GDSL-type esterase/lipase family protein [Sediminibacterium ginsengisoli]SJZ88373.1 Lysophospholipase L1 [Sediminibacterium ginsengisoli]
MKKLNILLLILFLSGSLKLVAQDKPDFWDDVQVIKQYDKMFSQPKGAILFTGSSSIRLWSDLGSMFRNYTVINRGVGGAVTNDIDRYVEDIIVPYKPRQIVLYIGENDVLKAPNGDTIFLRFKKLFEHIRSRLPDVPVVYIAIKPSPSRVQYLPVAIRANELISAYLKEQTHTAFVDVFKPMLDAKGQPRPELFKSDMLHMNTEGYKIWQKLIQPLLIKEK